MHFLSFNWQDELFVLSTHQNFEFLPLTCWYKAENIIIFLSKKAGNIIPILAGLKRQLVDKIIMLYI